MSTVLHMSRWFEGCGLVHASQRTAQPVDWASQLPSTSPLSQSESLRLADSRSYIVCTCVCVCVWGGGGVVCLYIHYYHTLLSASRES